MSYKDWCKPRVTVDTTVHEEVVDLDTPRWEDGEPTGFYLPDGDGVIHATGPNTYQRRHVRDIEYSYGQGNGLQETHDAKAAYNWAAKHGFPLPTASFDTALADYVLNGGVPHDPVSLSWRHLRVRLDPTYPLDVAHALHRCIPVLRQELEDTGTWALYHGTELPLTRVLHDIERTGVRLDIPHLNAFNRELELDATQTADAIFRMVGKQFELGSTQQVADVLYGQLGLPKGRRTKKGFTTDSKQLLQIADMHPVIDLLLHWRKVTKLTSTYVGKLPNCTRDGRLHCKFNQLVCITGRLSSSDPNLQNIPIRTAEGREVRKAFVTDPGWVLLAADYSQVELRILAHYSQDETMLRCFTTGEDLHTGTARTLFGLAEGETPDKAQRSLAKIVNFSIPYGTTPHGLALQIHDSVDKAYQLQQGYFSRFYRVKDYIEAQHQFGREHGYVETFFHRRRYLPDILSYRAQRREESERFAANHPIQGTAADVMKIALVNIARELFLRNMRARLLMQVHDEAVLECPEEEVPILAPLVRDCMRNAVQLCIPLDVEVKVGKNWGAMSKWEDI